MGNNSQKQNSEGYHVLKVTENSPADASGLMPFFDFIIGANGTPLRKNNPNDSDKTFKSILDSFMGRPLGLTIYNSKFDSVREIYITPGVGEHGGWIGAVIRYVSINSVNENVWHVMDVYPNSPASTSGLEPETDYIVGTPDILFTENEDFFTFVENNVLKSIPLYVFSTKTDTLRTINIVPNPSWGGSGLLGCDINFGLLHRIPLNPAEEYKPAKPIDRAQILAQMTQPISHTQTSPLQKRPSQNGNLMAAAAVELPRVATPPTEVKPSSPSLTRDQPSAAVQPASQPAAQQAIAQPVAQPQSITQPAAQPAQAIPQFVAQPQSIAQPTTPTTTPPPTEVKAPSPTLERRDQQTTAAVPSTPEKSATSSSFTTPQKEAVASPSSTASSGPVSPLSNLEALQQKEAALKKKLEDIRAKASKLPKASSTTNTAASPNPKP